MSAFFILIALFWVFHTVTRNHSHRQREIEYRVDREQEERDYYYQRRRHY